MSLRVQITSSDPYEGDTDIDIGPTIYMTTNYTITEQNLLDNVTIEDSASNSYSFSVISTDGLNHQIQSTSFFPRSETITVKIDMDKNRMGDWVLF